MNLYRVIFRAISHWKNLKSATMYWLKQYEDVRYRLNTIGQNVRLGSAVLEGNCNIGPDTQLYGQIRIGKYTTLGWRNIVHGGTITVGCYCQFGPDTAIYALNHNTNHLTTYNNRALFSGELKACTESQPVSIGHDVWIGHGAIILPSVKIGNGAVIGAGSVVTKDVCDYGIAVGNPARVIKKRFDDEIIELLLQWKWWEHSPNELAQYGNLFRLDLNQDRQQAVISLLKIIEANEHPE